MSERIISALNILAITNLNINLYLFYRIAPVKITNINSGDCLGISYGDYQRGIVKKKGIKRKPKNDLLIDLPDSNENIKKYNPGKVKLPLLYDKESSKFRTFANSISVIFADIIYLESDNKISVSKLTPNIKSFNVKIFSNGKLQITGCKAENQYIRAINYTINLLKNCQSILDQYSDIVLYMNEYLLIPDHYSNVIFPSDINKKIYSINNMKIYNHLINDNDNNYDINKVDLAFNNIFKNDGCSIYAAINIVVQNYVFDMIKHFPNGINRVALNNLFVTNAEELKCDISYYVSYRHSGVNIKYPCKIEKTKYDVFIFQNNDLNDIIVEKKYITHKVFGLLLSKQGIKKLNREKHHTFIVFESGKIIQSGNGTDMDEIYNTFKNVLLSNIDLIKE